MRDNPYCVLTISSLYIFTTLQWSDTFIKAQHFLFKVSTDKVAVNKAGKLHIVMQFTTKLNGLHIKSCLYIILCTVYTYNTKITKRDEQFLTFTVSR